MAALSRSVALAALSKSMKLPSVISRTPRRTGPPPQDEDMALVDRDTGKARMMVIET
ncbi:MAG TPA: hypothetical protein VJM34_16250 [Novosphingobium sp.]|nr:hypothetical protein [Novosphingobium sp.]